VANIAMPAKLAGDFEYQLRFGTIVQCRFYKWFELFTGFCHPCLNCLQPQSHFGCPNSYRDSAQYQFEGSGDRLKSRSPSDVGVQIAQLQISRRAEELAEKMSEA
jgi:hypothetical protein